MYVKKKKVARRKTKKRYRTKKRGCQKGGFIDPFAPFKMIGKMMDFQTKMTRYKKISNL